ncbi:MAG: 2OG-Fe(II) oxygenase [Parasulfuritortus sp.]|jgi:SM-20-related protein|nr:2OG-Fe(II) oxygenase [Parasulfuritortus sp.]
MNEDTVQTIIADLAEKGWCVLPDFMDPATVADLRTECLARHAAGGFHRAGVGAGRAEVVSEIRSDVILWLEPEDTHPAIRRYLAATEALRQRVNQEFFLGLNELESHFAVYSTGAGYKKHLDRFREDDRRALTAIVYLNDRWTEADGGQLRLWVEPSGEGESIDIQPTGGTLVTFLSELYWHEVQPAMRQRLALTGWFKRR